MAYSFLPSECRRKPLRLVAKAGLAKRFVRAVCAALCWPDASDQIAWIDPL